MKLNKIALVLAMSGIGQFAYAQSDADIIEENGDDVEKITVTGSSIKRTALEGDLPLTIISRDEIDLRVSLPLSSFYCS